MEGFGLWLFVCELGHCLSLLKPPKLERKGASGAQIVWETSERLQRNTQIQAKMGSRKAWPTTVAAVASPINNFNDKQVLKIYTNELKNRAS